MGGQLHLRFHTQEIIEVSYHFDSVPVDETLKEASKYITQPAASLSLDQPIVITEENYAFILTCGQSRVVLEKRDASVSLWYGGNSPAWRACRDC